MLSWDVGVLCVVGVWLAASVALASLRSEAADAQFALAFSHKLDEEQTAVLIAKHALVAELDVTALAKALAKQAD